MTPIALSVPVKTLRKVAGVSGGYVAAWLAASAVVAFRVAGLDVSAAQASSGMYAFGDSLLFLGVFGVVALVPSGVALSLLRDHGRVWTVLSTLALAIAVTGVTAAILFAVGSHAPPSTLATLAGFSVLRILVAPLLAMTFLVCTIFAPRGASRSAFIAATVMEAVVSAYGGVVWFVPLFLRPQKTEFRAHLQAHSPALRHRQLSLRVTLRADAAKKIGHVLGWSDKRGVVQGRGWPQTANLKSRQRAHAVYSARRVSHARAACGGETTYGHGA